MPENFVSAATRHLEDAHMLFTANRPDNSVYLAGYTVECGLKVLIEMAGSTSKRWGHELATLSGDALLLACLISPSVRRYTIPESPDFIQLRLCWNPEMRYVTTGEIKEQEAQACLRAAEQVYRAIIIEAVLDGRSKMS